MDKLKMQSRDVVGGNVEKIAALFPQCVTERLNKDGKPELAIDFDMLRAELSNEVLDDGEERYQFTWPDKRAASRLANEPVNLTLRPCREESVDFDTTQNLYIEGDNLDVLKVLRETYLGRVKMIYIDPPYNTGNDFVYSDKFVLNSEEWEAQGGVRDEEGNIVVDPMQRNTESNGRFHTDWLNMIYPRLKVARDLLSDDGVIFISIDDNEVENLRKVCNEIFGEQNFISTFIWEKRKTRENRRIVSVRHDYILTYVKNFENRGMAIGLEEMNQDAIDRYKNPDNDPRGPWTSVPAIAQAGHATKSQFYTIVSPNGNQFDPPSGSCWRYTKDKMKEAIAENRIWFGNDGNGVPRIKKFLTEGKQGLTPETMLIASLVGTNDSAKRDLTSLFDGTAVFETPKPMELVRYFISICEDKEGIFLDFFSGTAATAHAVMKLNAEDGGKRKFIMVQLPEVTDEKSEARKAGYETICQIGEERIRRAGKKILEEVGNEKGAVRSEDRGNLFEDDNSSPLTSNSSLPDVGFRVLKLDSSNMENVFYTPDKFDLSLLDSLVDNIKADRSGEDLLFQVMLNLGIELSAKIERKGIAGKEVFSVDDDYLLACFDKDVNETTIEEMAKLLPTHLVIRDASSANDNVLDNFDQIIESYSTEKRITTHIL